MVKYFFDSYAVIELINGNSKYAGYSHEPVVITIFNLAEIYYFAVREYGAKTANQIFNQFKHSVIEVDDEILKEAIRFRVKCAKRRLSYADCIGYIYALKNDLVFLTGDKEVKGMKNVEFVK